MVLSDDDLRISDLESENMRRLAVHGETMLREMNIIADYMQIKEGGVDGGFDAATMINARLTRFKDAADLLTVARRLPAMAEALSIIAPRQGTDFTALARLATETTESSVRAMKLSAVSAKLAHVKEVTNGLEPYHVEMLAGLRDKSEVVNFLRREAKDFSARLDLIRQNLQGNVVHMGVMNDLDVTHNILSRLLSEGESARNLGDLARVLKDICPDEARKGAFLTGIETTRAHLHEIELWFQAGVGAVSADSVLRQVRMFQECGWFVGRTPRHEAGGGLELEYRVGDNTDRQSSEVLLQTLLSAVFSRGEELLGDGSAVLARFIEAHGAAEDAVTAMAAAEADGLPYMQGCTKRLGSVADAEELRAFAADVRSSAKAWREVIARALERAPRLRLLDRAQLLMFMRLVGAVGVAAPASDIPPRPRSHVVAYVSMCFPDVLPDGDTPALQRLAGVVRRIVEAEIGDGDAVGDEPEGEVGEADDEHRDAEGYSSGDAGGAEERKGGERAPRAAVTPRAMASPGRIELAAVQRTLQVCLRLVSRGEIALRGAGALDGDAECADGTKDNISALIAPDASPVAVYCHLLAVAAVLPHACQFLWCAATTTEDQVRDFVERVRWLPQLRYSIVGVDKLPSASREGLLQAIVDDSQRLENRMGWLTLVFLSNTGSDGFRFLETPYAALSRMDASVAEARFLSQGAARAFGTRALVCGNANAGKSTRARAILAAKCGTDKKHTRALAVHESFSAAEAAKWYVAAVESSAETGDIGLHINVLTWRLAFAHELDETVAGPVNEEIGARLLVMLQFMHSLVASGLIVDTTTGVVAGIDWSRKHHVVLELPAIMGYSAETDATQHAYLAHLPAAALGFALDVVTWRAVAISVDDKARLVAWFWRERATLDAPAVVLPQEGTDPRCAALTEVEVRDALHHMWNIRCPRLVAVHHTRREHVKLVFERCVFLARLKAEHTALRRRDPYVVLDFGLKNMLSSLFELLVDEATQFKDGSLQRDWFRMGGISCRPMKSGPPQDGDYFFTPFALLYLNVTENARATTAARGITNVMTALLESASDTDRTQFAATLRDIVARSIGVSETTLQRVVQVQSFCIMPEFAVRLLVLNEFVRIGTPVILKGETGTGKTELLMLLSSLLNCDERVFPDMTFQVRRAFEDAQNRGLLNGVGLSSLFEPHAAAGAAPVAAGAAPVADTRKLLPAAALLSAVEAAFTRESEGSAFFRAFAPFIIPKMLEVFDKFTLMQRPELVDAVFQRFAVYERARAGNAETEGAAWPEGDVLIVGEGVRDRVARPVNTAAELAQFLLNCVSARPRSTFKHIRMDPDLSADGWRRLMADVRKDANELTRLCSRDADLKLRLTVFVDELNTTTVMGLVKEALIDRSVDGERCVSGVGVCVWGGGGKGRLLIALSNRAAI